MTGEQRVRSVVADRSAFSAHRWPLVVLLAAALAACGGAPKRGGSAGTPTQGGGYYLDDGPGASAPANLDAIPDAVPKAEPLYRGTMKPYVVMGRSYTPMTRLTPYRARGVATWYGRRYHGKQTSSGEPYDMYAMTAAHTILPIPSYVRVTNLANGKSVVVRVNDRGPFIDSRLIDLSYTAAHKLGIIGAGSGMVEIESIVPGMTPPEPPVAVAPAAPASTPAATAASVVAETALVVAVPLPPSPPATTAASAGAPAVPGGSYLQFGAFGVRENAESYLARLQTQAAWLAANLRIHQNDGMFRVQAGPYADDAAAREAAERASETLGMKPLVIAR
ncbi:MAG: septal ring lytic transglycosylase RlpA family protein [Betaproteobacteria bacterium]|nr:MAG: septal ring lytic transglycosylase RlpA family protein [Betaproteobacteria bacterium]